jgi:hypothetical protein
MQRRKRQKRLRPVLWAGSALGVLAVVLAALVLHDLVRARGQLVAARATLASAIDDPSVLRTPEGRVETMAKVNAAVGALGAARKQVVGSPALSVVGALPVLHGQRAGLVQLIQDSDSAAVAGRDLLNGIDALAERNQLRDGALPIDGLGDLQARVRAAGEAIRGLARPTSSLWGPLGKARTQFDDVVSRSSTRLLDGADAIGAARTFLGSGGDRRYLVGLQNNAEMRDQGMVLSYVPLRLSGGRLSFEKGGSIIDLALSSPAPTTLPPGTQAVFGPARPTERWQAVNATADFAFSGRAMVDMYHQATGKTVDGVIVLDVPGLAALLRAVGPVTVDGAAEPITADNAGRILLHDFYQNLTYTSSTSDLASRREHLNDVLQAVVNILTKGAHDSVALGRELGDAAKGGHLHLWSTVPGEESVFERTGLGGGPATQDADRTFHVAVENRSGTKVDYYVKPVVHQQVSLTPQGAAVVRTTVVVDNQAPVTDSPSYQLGPDEFTQKPGDYLAWVLLWGPAGSVQQAAVPESGLNLSNYITGVAASQKKEVTFETIIPGAVRNGHLLLRLVPQARLDPIQLDVHLDPGKWKVSGPLSWSGPWDTVRVLDWKVSR